MPTKDSSTWTNDKKALVVSSVSKSINTSKLRSPIAYSYYTPSLVQSKNLILYKTIAPILPLNYIKTVLAGAYQNTSPDLDGIGLNARFLNGYQVLYNDIYVYIVNRGSQTIRRCNIYTGEVTTYAGQYGLGGSTNGTTLLNSTFQNPTSATFDSINNILYVATSPSIRQINLGTNTISTFYTRGSELTELCSIVYKNGFIYGADSYKSIIFKIEVSTKTFSVVAGTSGAAKGYVDGASADARFSFNGFLPQGLTADNYGNLYLADSGNTRIRKIVISTGEVSTILNTTNGVSVLSYYNDSVYYIVTIGGFLTMRKINVKSLVDEEVLSKNIGVVNTQSIAIVNEKIIYSFGSSTTQIVKYSA